MASVSPPKRTFLFLCLYMPAWYNCSVLKVGFTMLHGGLAKTCRFSKKQRDRLQSICLIIVCVNIRTLFVTAKSFFRLMAFYCMSNGAELAPLQAVLNRNANLLRGTLFKIGLLFYYLISVGAEQMPVVAVVYLYFKYILIVRQARRPAATRVVRIKAVTPSSA